MEKNIIKLTRNHLILLIIFTIFAKQTFSLHLVSPYKNFVVEEIERKPKDTIGTQIQQQQQQLWKTLNETSVVKKSYDKNNDVDENDWLRKQQQEQQEQQDINTGINDDHENNERNKRDVSTWFIAPNTRWCGRGNLANGTYNQLGGASAADKCCRKHDHCQLYIPAMSNRFELFNYRPYTLSHCQCDRRFRTCLKMANDEDANTIGKLFFNMVQTQCFIVHNEKTCIERDEQNGDCKKHHVRRKAFLKNNQKF